MSFTEEFVEYTRSRTAWTPVSTTLGGYVLAHLARKCYSTVKQQLQHQAGYSALFLSEMDASFVAAFAIGTICMIACGKVGGAVDRPSALLTVGLWGSGFCLFLISGAVWFDLVGFNESFGDLFVVAICFIFGLVQAAATTTTGQPTVPPVQSVVGTTGSGSGSGPIGAKTAAAARAGEIMAAVITCLVLDMEWSFEWALLIPAVASMAWAMTTRRSSPRVVDTAEMVLSTVAEAVEDYESDEMLETPDPSDHSSAALAAPITPFTLLTSHDVPAAPGLAQSVVALMQTPRVAQYAVIYGFVQVIHLTLYFWLPYHLGRTFDPSTANMIGTSYSVGMLLMLPSVCVPVVQYTCHHIGGGRASAVAAAFVLLQAIPLGILATYEEAGFPPIAVIILLTCMGMVTECLIACVTLAGTMGLVVSEEPTTYRPGPADALDMIRGLGTLLAAVGLLPIGPLQAAYGWGSVWLYLVANLVVTIVLLSLEICVEHLRGTTRTRDNGENNPGTYAELSAFDAINDSAE